MMLVARAEEPGRTTEKARAAFIPPHSFAGQECLRNLWLIKNRGGNEVADGAHKHWALLIGKYHCLLRAHGKLARDRVIVDISGGGLRGEPLAHVTLGGRGRVGKPGGTHWSTLRQGLVESQLVPDQHQGSTHCRPDVDEHLAHKGVELVPVDLHVSLRYLRAAICPYLSMNPTKLFRNCHLITTLTPEPDREISHFVLCSQ